MRLCARCVCKHQTKWYWKCISYFFLFATLALCFVLICFYFIFYLFLLRISLFIFCIGNSQAVSWLVVWSHANIYMIFVAIKLGIVRILRHLNGFHVHDYYFRSFLFIHMNSNRLCYAITYCAATDSDCFSLLFCS